MLPRFADTDQSRPPAGRYLARNEVSQAAKSKEDTAERIDERFPLADQACASVVQGLDVELLLQLDRNEPHRRPGRGFGNRPGFEIVILVRFDIRLNVTWRHQPDVVLELAKLATEMMRPAA